MHHKLLLCSSISLLLFSATLHADDTEQLKEQLRQLKAQLIALEDRLAQLEQKPSTTPETPELTAETATTKEPATDGIRLGGAVRTNYSHTSYSDGNKNRGGDFAFDIFRLNLHGSVGDVSLDAEIRFFDYMTAVKYAYVGYQFSDNWRALAGITQVPFGNWPYNSHNYFFSTNYYIGLEDDHDLGIVLQRQLKDHWQLDLGFFKNDELGGIDGYVSDRSDRYSYDIVGSRPLTEGLYDPPTQALAEYNTLAARLAYQIPHGTDFITEIGVSALSGGLHDGLRRAGDYHAWALHLNGHYDRWNLQLQHGEYRYDLGDVSRIAVGAYAFYDSIAAEAKTSTVNLAYSLPVEWGPITGLQFYNNWGLIHDKSDQTANTMMNVLGFSIAAGGLFTYIDWVQARNQPFVGGSIAGDAAQTERRFNINIGYYF